MCKVSIIVPAFNAEEHIHQTIHSILSQSYLDFECIVIDDGSTDRTLEVLHEIKDARIKLIKQANSGGPAKPRNVGIAQAKGQYIVIFDSDDIMLDDKLSMYVDILNRNEHVGVIFSDFAVIDDSGTYVVDRFLNSYNDFRQILKQVEPDLYHLDPAQFVNEIVKANFIGTSSVCFRRRLIGGQDIFDDSVKSGDDILAWVRLSQRADVYFLDKVLHQYRKRAGSISNTNAERLLKNKILVLDKINNLSPMSKKYVRTKMNEYLYSLGYVYFKSRRYSEAMTTYSRVVGWQETVKKFIAIIKVFVAKVLGV